MSAARGADAGLLVGAAAFAAREAALARPALGPLLPVVEDLRRRHGAVPYPDPFDGGAAARLLLLLETPGPGAEPLRFVSRDNPTGTGRNLRRFLAEAGWPRADTVIWNAVPWVIHAPGARNRAPRAGEVAAGLASLPAVLAALPRLRAAVLAGRLAARAAPVLEAAGVPAFLMPHPSPTYVCTSPAIAPRILASLRAARAVLAEEPFSAPTPPAAPP